MKKFLISALLLPIILFSQTIFVDWYESDESYLLDTYTGAAVAFSLRQLKSGVTDVIEVRRDSDDAESDFTPVEITDGTLATWVGAGNDGFIVTWYDQSGNNRHAIQTTTTDQPLIVDNGVIITSGSLPAIWADHDSTANPLIIASQQASDYVGANEELTIVSVHEQTSGVGSNQVFELNQFTTSSETIVIGLEGDARVGTNSRYVNYAHGNGDYIVVASSDSSGAELWVDGVSRDTDTWSDSMTATATDNARLFIYSSSGRMKGYSQELIIWPENHSSDVSDIFTKINGYYSKY